MRMRMMQVRCMLVGVNHFFMHMWMAVLANDGIIMRVRVMAVAVIVPMLVKKRFVFVRMIVIFNGGKVRSGNHDENGKDKHR